VASGDGKNGKSKAREIHNRGAEAIPGDIFGEGYSGVGKLEWQTHQGAGFV